MRLVTWNCCRGAYARKAPLLDSLAPDIAVLNYCFIPEAWRKDVRRVEIGGYEEWRPHSDHRPLLVEVTPARQPC